MRCDFMNMILQRIFILSFIVLFFAACQKKGATSVTPVGDTVITSPYYKVDSFYGTFAVTQWADGCSTQSRSVNGCLTLSYLLADSSILVAGPSYKLDNVCASPNTGLVAGTYNRLLFPVGGVDSFLFNNDGSHIYETVLLRGDSLIVSVEHWRCNSDDQYIFRGKRN